MTAAALRYGFLMGVLGWRAVDVSIGERIVNFLGRKWRELGGDTLMFMGKSANDDVMDAALNEVAANANLMTACSAEPTTRTEAVTTFALADVVPTFTGPVNGDTSGRKHTSDQKTGVTIDTTGTANHVAQVDGTRLLYVTTCTPQALTTPGTVTFGAWDVEFADPT